MCRDDNGERNNEVTVGDSGSRWSEEVGRYSWTERIWQCDGMKAAKLNDFFENAYVR
ncbi:hypothetical protein D3C87_1096140 [compost metagenome]